jgi:hypothetical protein
LLLMLVAAAHAGDYEPGTPSTYLFDTRTALTEAPAGDKLDPKSGWSLVPEDDLTHKFDGDAVILNDRLLVLLRRTATGAEVYGRPASGPKRRAELVPVPATGRGAASLASLKIVENGPAAVALVAQFTTPDGGACSVQYRLTAGQMIVEVRPGEGATRLAVRAESRYVVIPEYFGDDMVFRAESFQRPRLRLPTENMFLSLLDDGNAELMCVWESRRQEVTAVRTQQGQKAIIAACEIDAARDRPIWVACLEGPGLWYEKTDPKALWQPLFPAKWRGNVLAPSSSYPCSFWHTEPVPTHVNAIEKLAQLLFYAMDRSQATPLDRFTPMDVLRNTLGVGPCQYILPTEGLATDVNPTPDNVMTFVEKQFQRKKEKKSADEIREMLEQMVEHVGRAQARIDRYGRAFASVPERIGELKSLAIEPCLSAEDGPLLRKRVRELADRVVALIGTDGAAGKCEKLGAQLRDLGAHQDCELAVYRMRARWLRQSAIMWAEEHPQDAEAAKKVQVLAEEALQTK